MRAGIVGSRTVAGTAFDQRAWPPRRRFRLDSSDTLGPRARGRVRAAGRRLDGPIGGRRRRPWAPASGTDRRASHASASKDSVAVGPGKYDSPHYADRAGSGESASTAVKIGEGDGRRRALGGRPRERGGANASRVRPFAGRSQAGGVGRRAGGAAP
ncbi:hypothetical protein X977_5504 [Burkholderia pseudomallei MSHR7504]|nr:hypothetical protein X977_5504 [Burkholderia pseudomallei MSHR7504]